MIPERQHKEAAVLASRDPERWVLRVWYIDSKGSVTERSVSPIRLTKRGLLVYCLGRQDVRAMLWARICGMRLQWAPDVLCPDAIKTLVDRRSEFVRLDDSTETT